MWKKYTSTFSVKYLGLVLPCPLDYAFTRVSSTISVMYILNIILCIYYRQNVVINVYIIMFY